MISCGLCAGSARLLVDDREELNFPSPFTSIFTFVFCTVFKMKLLCTVTLHRVRSPGLMKELVLQQCSLLQINGTAAGNGTRPYERPCSTSHLT